MGGGTRSVKFTHTATATPVVRSIIDNLIKRKIVVVFLESN